MKTPARSFCCRRGYWNALAYGAAVYWALSVVCWSLFPLYRTGFIPSLPHLPWRVALFNIQYVYFFPSVNGLLFELGDPLHEWLFSLFSGNMPPNVAVALVWIIPIAVYYGLQWIVFLGMLRLYWWSRRAPVTGRSARVAILVMVGLMACISVFVNILEMSFRSP